MSKPIRPQFTLHSSFIIELSYTVQQVPLSEQQQCIVTVATHNLWATTAQGDVQPVGLYKHVLSQYSHIIIPDWCPKVYYRAPVAGRSDHQPPPSGSQVDRSSVTTLKKHTQHKNLHLIKRISGPGPARPDRKHTNVLRVTILTCLIEGAFPLAVAWAASMQCAYADWY